MPPDSTPIPVARHEARHSHIGIRLQCRVGERWERMEALGWNVEGFGFHFPQALAGPNLEFKRGLTRFDGTVVWEFVNTSDQALLEALLNELIFKRAQQAIERSDLNVRLLKLMRVSGMVSEKLRVLASLGLSLTDQKLADLVDRRRQEQPLIHYGVRVQSPAWREIVQSALSVSSVVTSLEKWSDAVARK